LKKFITVFLFTTIIFLTINCKNQSMIDHNDNPKNCRIVTPSDNDIFTKGELIQIVAETNRLEATIDKVIFLVDDIEKFKDEQYPFEFSWDTSNEYYGTKTIKAEAYYNNNKTAVDKIDISLEWRYEQPKDIGDGWDICSLSDVDMDTTLISNMIKDLKYKPGHGIHSIVIAKKGKLVLDEYFEGKDLYEPYKKFTPLSLHCLCSVTKSFASALLGIAIDKEFIPSEDERIFDFFQDYCHLKNEDKDKITIQHLLTMTSGFEWEENAYPFSDPRNDLIQFNSNADPIGFILGKPIIHAPGSTFKYNGGNVNLIGEIITRNSCMRIEKFSKIFLFDPLNISNFKWIRLEPSDLTYVSGDLHLRPRDMAKFGNLYLNKGTWKGNRIISKNWIDRSTAGHSLGGAYGFLWWRNNIDSNEGQVFTYYAGGWGGQFIFVFDDLEMVVVFTGGNFDINADLPVFNRLKEFIIPAAK